MSHDVEPPIADNDRVRASFYIIMHSVSVDEQLLLESASVESAMMDYWDALVRCDEKPVWDHYSRAFRRALEEEQALRQSMSDMQEDWELKLPAMGDNDLLSSSHDATFNNGTVVIPPSASAACPLPGYYSPLPTDRRHLQAPSSPAAYLMMQQRHDDYSEHQWEEDDTLFHPRPA